MRGIEFCIRLDVLFGAFVVKLLSYSKPVLTPVSSLSARAPLSFSVLSTSEQPWRSPVARARSRVRTGFHDAQVQGQLQVCGGTYNESARPTPQCRAWARFEVDARSKHGCASCVPLWMDG